MGSIMRVTAYQKIVPLDTAALTPDGYVVDEMGNVVRNAICPLIDPSAGARNKGLEEGKIYSFDSTLTFACYNRYQHQNFIEVLCELAKYTPSNPSSLAHLSDRFTQGALEQGHGPFYELISFVRQAGTIGPFACNKLAHEFSLFRPKAQAMDSNLDFNGAFYDQYMNWLEVFCIAGEDGLVSIF